jgi:DNA ligase-1
MRPLLATILLLLCAVFNSAATEAPALSLAQHYHRDIDISRYYISEKLDGVRVYWDGQQLWSRQGNRFHAPAWFSKDFPKQALDGELWLGRGQFEKLLSTVSKQSPVDAEWQAVKFYAFDLPHSEQRFEQRLAILQTLIPAKHPHLKLVRQWLVSSHEMLQQALQNTVDRGGEGLMLHRRDSFYRSGRNSDFLKVKPRFDAEATVLAHLPGSGKFNGMMGSLLVQNSEGLQFRIGTGFKLAERKNPPPLGATITYEYSGLTRNGLPRHASFLRIRNDQAL